MATPVNSKGRSFWSLSSTVLPRRRTSPKLRSCLQAVFKRYNSHKAYKEIASNQLRGAITTIFLSPSSSALASSMNKMPPPTKPVAPVSSTAPSIPVEAI